MQYDESMWAVKFTNIIENQTEFICLFNENISKSERNCVSPPFMALIIFESNKNSGKLIITVEIKRVGNFHCHHHNSHTKKQFKNNVFVLLWLLT